MFALPNQPARWNRGGPGCSIDSCRSLRLGHLYGRIELHERHLKYGQQVRDLKSFLCIALRSCISFVCND